MLFHLSILDRFKFYIAALKKTTITSTTATPTTKRLTTNVSSIILTTKDQKNTADYKTTAVIPGKTGY